MSRIAIIPARGGSKRIPRKNIKCFLGKPIIAYSVETALQSKLFDEVMVSTDDEEIADVAKCFGAVVPFMRSKENSNDFATTMDVVKEVLNCYEKNNRKFDYGCCIYPAAPFITSELLRSAFDKLVNEQRDCVFPVAKFSNSVWRAMKLENEKLSMWWPENLNKRSQDLPSVYYDAGQFYWFNIDSILEESKLLTDNTSAIILNELAIQDIDTPEDWKLAEFKYSYLERSKNE